MEISYRDIRFKQKNEKIAFFVALLFCFTAVIQI